MENEIMTQEERNQALTSMNLIGLLLEENKPINVLDVVTNQPVTTTPRAIFARILSNAGFGTNQPTQVRTERKENVVTLAPPQSEAKVVNTQPKVETMEDWVRRTAEEAAREFGQETNDGHVRKFLGDGWPTSRLQLRETIRNWYRVGALCNHSFRKAQDMGLNPDYPEVHRIVKDLMRSERTDDMDAFAQKVFDKLKEQEGQIHGISDIEEVAQKAGFTPEKVGQRQYRDLVSSWSNALAAASGPDKTGILDMAEESFLSFMENMKIGGESK